MSKPVCGCGENTSWKLLSLTPSTTAIVMAVLAGGEYWDVNHRSYEPGTRVLYKCSRGNIHLYEKQ